jgi:hypothetical protein
LRVRRLAGEPVFAPLAFKESTHFLQFGQHKYLRSVLCITAEII